MEYEENSSLEAKVVKDFDKVMKICVFISLSHEVPTSEKFVVVVARGADDVEESYSTWLETK